MGYFEEHGYPRRAVLEYLLNLANSNFEDWRRANPMKPYEEFEFALKKLGNTGALFDFVKLDNVSKEFIARMSAEDIFRDAHAWAKQYNANLLQLMESDATLVKNILNIERTGTKARKDITTWASLPNELEYFFDAHFKLTKEEAIERFAPVADDDARAVASKFAAIYSADDDKDAWFEKVKKLAEELGYAANVKDAQANPGKYKGNVSDIAKVLRVLLTGRAQTPDLHSVMKVLGKERCLKRLALLLA
jgi:glutamyl-tRNA synthetase